MMLDLADDATFYFDAAAADRPVRFVEKFCRHYEGRHAGKPFILHPLQKQIVRDIFGWKWRETGARRFTDVYFEAGVGAGKSPLLAALGLYGLMADGEPAAQVYSLASTYGQARVVFASAKQFVRESEELSDRLDVVEREIRHRKSGSTWQIVSGKGPGAGCRPSMILGDEVHEWGGPGAYQALRDRMFKRTQPLLITATNAGQTRASFCWQLREKALAALAGTGELTLYPVIWAADDDADTQDPAAWRAANPLIGITVEERQIAQNAAESVKDEVEEANFRRLNLGIWPKTGAGRWLNMADWDACTSPAPPPADAPLYQGLDLSQTDDLCAAVFVTATPEKMYVAAHFWITRAAAERYEAKDGIPYSAWARDFHLDIVPEPTIGAAVRRRIAAAVLARGKSKIKAVCYDRYKADAVVADLENAGVACVPVPQGYSLSPGCTELERRIKERSIVIAPNPVLRFCAENTEVKYDDRGNFWPVKPNANARGGNGYKGTPAKKIDGIAALVTALTEARKHAFPPARKAWQGSISVVTPANVGKKEPAPCLIS